jgi:hypothetical protein
MAEQTPETDCVQAVYARQPSDSVRVQILAQGMMILQGNGLRASHKLATTHGTDVLHLVIAARLISILGVFSIVILALDMIPVLALRLDIISITSETFGRAFYTGSHHHNSAQRCTIPRPDSRSTDL